MAGVVAKVVRQLLQKIFPREHKIYHGKMPDWPFGSSGNTILLLSSCTGSALKGRVANMNLTSSSSILKFIRNGLQSSLTKNSLESFMIMAPEKGILENPNAGEGN